MFIIDSNILVSTLMTSYENDEQTRTYLKKYKQIEVIKRIIPDFILSEFETLMVQVIPSRYSMALDEKNILAENTRVYIGGLMKESTIISPGSNIIETAFSLYKHNFPMKYISFTDSLLLATAQEKGYTVFTKDRKINDIAKERNISFYKPSNTR